MSLLGVEVFLLIEELVEIFIDELDIISIFLDVFSGGCRVEFLDLLDELFLFVVVFLFVFNSVCLNVEFLDLFGDFFELMVDDDEMIDNVCKGFVDVGVVLRFDKCFFRRFLIIGDKYIV